MTAPELLTTELTHRRVLGAVRLLDAATGLPVLRPLSVRAAGVDLRPNRRGFYVLHGALGMAEHTAVFDEALPAVVSLDVDLEVRDPNRLLLPRRFPLHLPRDPDPEAPDSLYEPVVVPLLPAPAAPVLPSWAVLRVRVVRQQDGSPLPAALLRVLRPAEDPGDPPVVVGRGLSDWQGRLVGEALVVVPGIPVTTWGNGEGGEGGETPVLIHEVPATLEAVYDPDFDPAGGQLPDPADLEARADELPTAEVAVQLASGRTESLTVEVSVP